MKRLIVIILLSLCLITPMIAKPNMLLPTLMEKWTCAEILEVYQEAGALHVVAGERLHSVKTDAAKYFWMSIRLFTIDLHAPLLEARTQKCKSA